MIKKNKNNIISIAEMTLQGGGQEINSNRLALDSNIDLASSIKDLQEDKANLYRWQFGEFIPNPDLRENITWKANQQYTFELPFLPDNGVYEIRGIIQMDFNSYNSSALYLYTRNVASNGTYTMIGGKQPNNCTGMELEHMFSALVRDKVWYINTGSANPPDATFRGYIRAYRKLYD